jgi:hypothetical protein
VHLAEASPVVPPAITRGPRLLRPLRHVWSFVVPST